ncbi:MAG: NHLP leader peptide family natural product precursor [Acidobacteria bacterium]|nr:MAG: NHLP leader peptide family natural product precursor [Acidobacteriota bacterium]RPJ63036.1 MAG: NHLP leader peptide family natural product precursor [Acidobacteriota bacterium]
MPEKKFSSRFDAEREIAKKATSDPGFRAALLANPKKAVAEAFGVNLPESFELKILEETPSRAYVVLPAQESETQERTLTDAELEAVAGGGWCLVSSTKRESNPDHGTAWSTSFRCTCW